MVTVHITPSSKEIPDDNGIGRVIHAQYKYLPTLGIELVASPDQADVIACHIQQGTMPRVDVLHCHGLYWTGEPGSGVYEKWNKEANTRILSAARRARRITVPSRWVSECFKRDMRITPTVLGHGIDLDQWEPLKKPQDYVLWNKNRAADVCDPGPAYGMAIRGAEVVSTFAPPDMRERPETFRVTGSVPHDTMRNLIHHAFAYLATTKETFGIGTLEALAAGVPVLGYGWGGTADLIKHKVNGYLVNPGDIDALMEGLAFIKEHRENLSIEARLTAEKYAWPTIMKEYATLYQAVAEERRTEKRGVSVVITNYNYGRYVSEAIDSCLKQTVPPDEIIVVDDGSTDESAQTLAVFEKHPTVRLLNQDNQGVAAARNRGIEAAKQPHIICLDADDPPQYIDVCLKAMKKDRGLGIVYTGLSLLSHDGTKLSPNEWPPPFDWSFQSTPANPPSNVIPSAAMFRKDMWARAGGYNQVYAPGEDAEFWTRGLSVGFDAKKVTNEHLFHYRLHEGSASRTKIYKPIDAWHPWMRDKLYPMAVPAPLAPLVRSYSDPLISVIIPVGPGHAQYVTMAIQSLLGQTYRDWEVIVICDSDRQEDIQEITRLNKTVFPFMIPLTSWKKGAGKARNLGLANARGELCVFLDADDYLWPDALFKMLGTYMHHEGKRYVYTDWWSIRPNEAPQAHQTPEYDANEWMYKGLHAVTVLMPTEQAKLIGGFDEKVKGWEDWDFFVKAAVNGLCGVRLPEPLLGYRMHTGERRERSLEQSSDLLALFRERYAAYAKGEKTMAGCGSCGGGGEAIIAAKERMGIILNPNQTYDDPLPPPDDENPMTRMEFIGDHVGAITYQGLNAQRKYRAGNNPHDRFLNVHPDDVRRLVETGLFRVVNRASRVQTPNADAILATVDVQ
jgi:glycosyltransferase involved in cell wall biosynthesis